MQLERADGEIRTVQVATAPGRYDGQDIGQAVVIDVTEQQQIQAQLEQERQFIEDALDTIEQSIRDLIERTLDHTDVERPHITISVQDEAPVQIELRDNALPSPRMEYTFIDDPGTLTPTNHPSGLGLWAVYVAISQSRGTLTITHPDPTGNKINIEIPRPPQTWT